MSQMHGSYEDLRFDLLDRLGKSLRVSGMSASAIAAELGVHRNTISNYLNGKTPIDRRTIVAWAHFTGVPLPWLESGATPPPVDPDDEGEPRPEVSAALHSLTEAKRRRAQGRVSTRRYQAAA